MEINPNHPVTSELRDQWQKICAILMHKFGQHETELTTADIDDFIHDGRNCIVTHVKKDVIVVKLVTIEEGERLAREGGGLPT